MGWDNWSNGGRDLTDKKDIEMDLKDNRPLLFYGIG